MLTNDQKNVFDHIIGELGGGKNISQFNPKFSYLTIGGFAGTGKTYLISALRQEIYNNWNHVKVAFVAFTGKASSVLEVKLRENNAIFYGDSCSTIHRLIYIPVFKYDNKVKKPVVEKWVRKDDIDFDLIFVDEASMVNLTIWKDLMEYHIPIIAVGDHGQLPPVGDNFNLMERPMYLLTEIKRQALDNPIIRLSQDVRNGIEIPFGFYDKKHNNVFKGNWNDKNCQNFFNSLNFTNDNIIMLCGRNSTRVSFNQIIRDKHGYRRPEPYPGERVIFLKNNYTSKVLNGMLGKVLVLLYEGKNVYDMTVLPDDYEEPYSGLVYNGCFGRETYDHFYEEMKLPKYKKLIKKSRHSSIDVCDFGYCITTHKSQGSEFDKVIVFDEKECWRNELDKRRWLYTACTRAKSKLFIIK